LINSFIYLLFIFLSLDKIHICYQHKLFKIKCIIQIQRFVRAINQKKYVNKILKIKSIALKEKMLRYNNKYYSSLEERIHKLEVFLSTITPDDVVVKVNETISNKKYKNKTNNNNNSNIDKKDSLLINNIPIYLEMERMASNVSHVRERLDILEKDSKLMNFTVASTLRISILKDNFLNSITNNKDSGVNKKYSYLADIMDQSIQEDMRKYVKVGTSFGIADNDIINSTPTTNTEITPLSSTITDTIDETLPNSSEISPNSDTITAKLDTKLADREGKPKFNPVALSNIEKRASKAKSGVIKVGLINKQEKEDKINIKLVNINEEEYKSNNRNNNQEENESNEEEIQIENNNSTDQKISKRDQNFMNLLKKAEKMTIKNNNYLNITKENELINFKNKSIDYLSTLNQRFVKDKIEKDIYKEFHNEYIPFKDTIIDIKTSNSQVISKKNANNNINNNNINNNNINNNSNSTIDHNTNTTTTTTTTLEPIDKCVRLLRHSKTPTDVDSGDNEYDMLMKGGRHPKELTW
jgi:hypothetical protein